MKYLDYEPLVGAHSGEAVFNASEIQSPPDWYTALKEIEGFLNRGLPIRYSEEEGIGYIKKADIGYDVEHWRYHVATKEHYETFEHVANFLWDFFEISDRYDQKS